MERKCDGRRQGGWNNGIISNKAISNKAISNKAISNKAISNKTMSDLIHYYAVPSRGMVTHWILEEVGVPFENRLLNLDENEHKTPEYCPDRR